MCLVELSLWLGSIAKPREPAKRDEVDEPAVVVLVVVAVVMVMVAVGGRHDRTRRSSSGRDSYG